MNQSLLDLEVSKKFVLSRVAATSLGIFSSYYVVIGLTRPKIFQQIQHYKYDKKKEKKCDKWQKSLFQIFLGNHRNEMLQFKRAIFAVSMATK